MKDMEGTSKEKVKEKGEASSPTLDEPKKKKSKDKGRQQCENNPKHIAELACKDHGEIPTKVTDSETESEDDALEKPERNKTPETASKDHGETSATAVDSEEELDAVVKPETSGTVTDDDAVVKPEGKRSEVQRVWSRESFSPRREVWGEEGIKVGGEEEEDMEEEEEQEAGQEESRGPDTPCPGRRAGKRNLTK